MNAMVRKPTNFEDETAITEVTIGVDGRIFVFGLSHEVLEILAELCPSNEMIGNRLAQLKKLVPVRPMSQDRQPPLEEHNDQKPAFNSTRNH